MKLLNNEDIIAHYGVKGMKWKNRKKSLFQTTNNNIKQTGEDVKRNVAHVNNYFTNLNTKGNKIMDKQNSKMMATSSYKGKQKVAKQTIKKMGNLAGSEYLKKVGAMTLGQVKSNVKYGKKLTNKTVLNKKGIKAVAKEYKRVKNITKNNFKNAYRNVGIFTD